MNPHLTLILRDGEAMPYFAGNPRDVITKGVVRVTLTRIRSLRYVCTEGPTLLL